MTQSEKQTVNELPEGWTNPRLEEIALINPRHPKTLKPSLKVSFVPMPRLSETDWRLDVAEQRNLGDVMKGYTHFADGDVLFAKITPCMENGKAAVATALASGLGCGTTELHVIRPLDGIDPRYIYHFLHQERFRREAALSFTGSAGQLRVPVSFIQQSPIPLAPRGEQSRIVVKLEVLLDAVDACQKRLAKIPMLIKRFRQSVLAAACAGRLTADWRDGHAINKDKPLRSKSESDALPEIPNGWTWVRLAELGNLGRGKSRHRPRDAAHLYGGQYPFIQTGDIARSGGRLSEHRQTYSEAGLAQSKLWPKGTVCITIAANIADSAILTYPACFPDSVVGVICDNRKCLAEYLEFFIRIARDDLSQFAPATAQKNINLAILNDVMVPLPILTEQQEIVRRVEALLKTADQIEARYRKAQAQVEKLTQSILAKAFRGELVPTEAELARREGRDFEPASTLLNRVLKDRAQPAGRTKARRVAGSVKH